MKSPQRRTQDRLHSARRATVIGSGPNGLAAAIVLARAGLQVEVYEAEAVPGGAARTMELTLPGFLHDFGSAVHPLAIGSPFLSSLPLGDYGLQWIHSPAPLVHPFDDGSAVTLERSLDDAAAELGADGKAWRRLMGPFADRWEEFAPAVLRPMNRFPKHPLLLARFGLRALPPARWLAHRVFKRERTRALFAGLAAHSFLSLDQPLSGAAAMLMGASAHAVGWPVPRGGAQSISNALLSYFASLGGVVHTSARVENLASLPEGDLIFGDVTPRQLLRIGGDRLSASYRRRLDGYRYGPGVFKVDYAMSEPVPWKSPACLRAATVHLGGSMEDIRASEESVRRLRTAERPFVLLAQPSLFDPTRAPEGKHTVWAYCHVPNGSTIDMLPKIEAQIERFAPGFRECVLARRVFSPARMESMDANLVGGDINGGMLDLRQFLFRPTWRNYRTSDSAIYICSSSTPPGGGVHGMCGYNAAQTALSRLGLVI